MCQDATDQKRRQFLIKATTAAGVVGATLASIPFLASFMPSQKARAEGGPIRVKIDNMKPGDQLTVMWRSKPIWIVCRSEQEIRELTQHTQALRDPNSEIDQQPPYAKNSFRSRRPDILVLVGVCTHLGCTPTYRPIPKSIDNAWQGGFFCSCHGSKFDLAGRVFKGVPAPINLEVPPYVYLSDTELMIGVNEKPEGI